MTTCGVKGDGWWIGTTRCSGMMGKRLIKVGGEARVIRDRMGWMVEDDQRW